MTIKVIIVREAPQGREQELKSLLLELRSAALLQPGFITSETLTNIDNSCEVVVVSTWCSREHWENWLFSELRSKKHEPIDNLTNSPTFIEIYEN
jgi:heme oxygenase (mycobilin-producing)